MVDKLVLFMFSGMFIIGGVGPMSIAESTEASDDTETRPFVTGGIYDKPYITQLGRRTSLGGYTEAHFRFEREEGITEEVTFEPKRFNIFTYTPVTDRVRVASELEFEEGGEEIKIEIAAIDFEIHEALTFRGGILLSPLGRFNIAHDSPANDLTDRPIVSVEMIGTALSEAGMGFFGAFYPSANSRLTYEIYGVNGFNDGVLIGSEDGTRIPAGKGNFEDNNQNPAAVGRIGISPHPSVEVGVSGHIGLYNVHTLDRLEVDEKRSLTIFVLDGEFRWDRFELLGEYARASVDIPDQLIGLQAERQQGLYLQGNIHFLKGLIKVLPESVFTGVVRYGLVDFDTNVHGNNQNRLTLGLNFRPTEDTVFKLDYQYNWFRDGFNLEARRAALLFSAATYF